MSYIYVASPYTAKSASVRRKRLKASALYAAKAMRAGVPVYSPLAHGEMLAKFLEIGTDYAAWKMHCEAMINGCSQLHVLCIPGWKKSVGVNAEIEYAKSIGKEIVYVEDLK